MPPSIGFGGDPPTAPHSFARRAPVRFALLWMSVGFGVGATAVVPALPLGTRFR
jgi:hypothetical protein